MHGFGIDLQTARKFAYLQLGTFTPNTTVTPAVLFGCPEDVGSMRVLGVSVICGPDVPADADGTMLVKGFINRVGGEVQFFESDLEAEVTGVNTVVDVDMLSVNTTLTGGEGVRFSLVSNSVAIDTNTNVTVVLEYVLLPRTMSNETEWPQYVGLESQY